MHENSIFCRTKSVAMTLKIMCTYAHYVTLGSRCKMANSSAFYCCCYTTSISFASDAASHSVTDLEKKSISNLQGWSSDAIVSSWAFISSLFYLFRTLLGAWRFSLFRSVYSSFHNRLDLIREPALYWVFHFIFPIILVCFIICKNEKKVLFVLVASLG